MNDILNEALEVRVGGSFVWPPSRTSAAEIKRAVFVAGGVGINPLMSIISHLVDQKKANGSLGFKVIFLYTTRHPPHGSGPSEILFWERLQEAFRIFGDEGELKLFLTGGEERSLDTHAENRRINNGDLLETLGPLTDRKSTVCYICGIPAMTDDFVAHAKKADGMLEENVSCEKWW